jgi:LPXTG-motif cell wall-anchored protein
MAYVQQDLAGGGTTVNVSAHSVAAYKAQAAKAAAATAAAVEKALAAAAHPPGTIGVSKKTMMIAGAGVVLVGVAALLFFRKKKA